MNIRGITSGIAVATLVAGGALIAPPAQAAAPAKVFSSCDMLHTKYPAGVAKNAKAARRAVRDGYSRPSTSRAAKKTYWQTYRNLDRDKDGTACES